MNFFVGRGKSHLEWQDKLEKELEPVQLKPCFCFLFCFVLFFFQIRQKSKIKHHLCVSAYVVIEYSNIKAFMHHDPSWIVNPDDQDEVH